MDFEEDHLENLTVKIGSGATPRGGENVYEVSGISLIRSQNVYDFEFSTEGLAFIDEKQARALANVEVLPNDILLNITGDSIGRCCIVPVYALPARVNQHVTIIRTNRRLDPRFLLYYINEPRNKAALLQAVHGATRRALTKAIIQNYKVRFPNFSIQRSIAEMLGALDDKIECNRRINKTLEQMAQALYKHWFVDFGPFRDGEFVDTEGGEIIFTTIEKFRLREGETYHPVLSERRNIIVIADEAHRTQYGLLDGFAYYMRRALPNASFIGFTGTPIDLADRDTQAVFGNVIHTYDIPQAQSDGAIVPIYYEARLVKLHLVNEEIDRELEEITETEEETERLKAKWAAIEAAAGTQERLEEIARDILNHFEERTKILLGKAIIVCMSRRICVRLYNEIIKLRPDWYHKDIAKGQIKIVMTGDLTKDPKKWSEAGHITTKENRERIKDRLKDQDDPLKMVIVRDMWLTGTDIPCLHTLYVDKSMRGHTLMQAIARVNRIFHDKPGGLVVDYIGIGHLLKEAARKYTASGFGKPTEGLDEAAKATFFQELDSIRKLIPQGLSVANWRSLSNIEMEDLCSRLYGHFTETDEKRDNFLTAEKRLSAVYSLVKHLPDCILHAEEVAFYQIIRAELRKTLAPPRPDSEREKAVRDLIDRSVVSKGVVDIFKVAGLDIPDISILDEKFLEEFKSKQQENLRLKLLEKLLMDEIELRKRKNLKKYRSFKEMLEETLHRYHNNAITAAEVIKTMIKIRQEMVSEDKRKGETGLSEEELAFYDAISGLGEKAYDMPFVCNLVREIVQAVKRNLKVDWTKSHRQDVKAGVVAAVKMVLRRKKTKSEQLDFILNRVMKQAEALYEDWPMAA